MLSQELAPGTSQPASILLRNFPHLLPACLPLGMDALYASLLKFYPTQRNPLQISALKKYWLGGADPLDYVNVYFNAGDPSQRIVPHWHYVSMGLTDLHGDGRVHRYKGQNQPSGFGFELTFRLKREPTNGPKPPLWPAAMMQHLAKYAFHSAKLSVGDFVKWSGPLDGHSESRIEHILLVSDPQLGPLSTTCGTVEFLQIVGICEEERKAIQKWNVYGLSELLRKHPATGGYWLVTDLRRGESVFDIDPCARDIVELGVASGGSNLTGIQAWCWWTEWSDYEEDSAQRACAASSYGPFPNSSDGVSTDYPPFGYPCQGQPSRPDQMPLEMSDYYNRLSSYMEHFGNSPAPARPPNSDNVFSLAAIHLRLNAEAGTFLPLALKGRLAHGRHFTFKSQQNGYGDITLLPPCVLGSFAKPDEPYACRGSWLHVQVCPSLQEQLLRDLNFLDSVSDSANAIQEPKTYRWPEYKLKITILPDVPGF